MVTRTATTPKAPETTTYIVEMRDGSRKKITVPKSWRVTFGLFAPGSARNVGKSALRFYEGSKENQRAVFQDVEAFRDMSIVLEEEITKTQDEILTKETPEGRKQFVVQASVKTWRNPDTPVVPAAEFMSLPKEITE